MGTDEDWSGEGCLIPSPPLAIGSSSAFFSAGDTFLIKGVHTEKLHLYVTLCDQSGNPPSFIAVPLNTVTNYTDRTLLLQPGDHPFINRESSVSYDLMHLFLTAQLVQLEQMNASATETIFDRRERMQPEVLKRIIDGALASDMAPKRMIKELQLRLNEISES